MSPKLKTLSGSDVIAALRHFGFEVVATRGSHAKLRRVRTTGVREALTVPVHKELARGTLFAIYRQAVRFIPESDLRKCWRSLRADS